MSKKIINAPTRIATETEKLLIQLMAGAVYAHAGKDDQGYYVRGTRIYEDAVSVATARIGIPELQETDEKINTEVHTILASLVSQFSNSQIEHNRESPDGRDPMYLVSNAVHKNNIAAQYDR